MVKENKSKSGRRGPEIQNRKARHEFEILETVEAGIVLRGTEVKSIRAGSANLQEAYARIADNEATLLNFQIQPYEQGNRHNHDPKRIKKLLLHKRELHKLSDKVRIKGQTLVPLRLYFNEKGIAKVELALAVGKKLHDKRQDARRKQDVRDMKRAERRGGL